MVQLSAGFSNLKFFDPVVFPVSCPTTSLTSLQLEVSSKRIFLRISKFIKGKARDVPSNILSLAVKQNCQPNTTELRFKSIKLWFAKSQHI
jgi:hypothetical protein